MAYSELKQRNIIAREATKLLNSVQDIRSKDIKTLKKIDFYNLAVHSFNYFDMPKEIPTRRTELDLCGYGATVFFKHKTRGYYLLPFVYTGGLDDYGDYKRVRPISMAMETQFEELTINEDCVIFRDNTLEIPSFVYANYYATAIADLVKTRKKNCNFLKVPFIFQSTDDIGTDKSNAFEIKKILYSDENEIAFITKAFSQLQLFDLKPQYFGREITELIKDLEHEYYEYLGVRHLATDKKERMTDDEVLINDEKYLIHTEKRLAPRVEAIEKANEIFGLNMRVEVNQHLFEEVKTSNVVASVAGGIHNDTSRNTMKSDRK